MKEVCSNDSDNKEDRGLKSDDSEVSPDSRIVEIVGKREIAIS